jgi:hypothetical protein
MSVSCGWSSSEHCSQGGHDRQKNSRNKVILRGSVLPPRERRVHRPISKKPPTQLRQMTTARSGAFCAAKGTCARNDSCGRATLAHRLPACHEADKGRPFGWQLRPRRPFDGQGAALEAPSLDSVPTIQHLAGAGT